VSTFAASVITAIRRVIGERPASLHEPTFAGREWEYVKECLDSGWVSSVGRYVDRFEADLAAFTGSSHAVATVNGTAALHVCMQLAGVDPGDEVLLPSLTFVATANAVRYCGATPHFVDCSAMTLGVDAAALHDYLADLVEMRDGHACNRHTNARISALIVMHAFGHPADLDPLLDLCRRHRIRLIEDAAESLGSYYKGRHTGVYGDLAALSFNGNKVITTGGGGAILTQDGELARRAKHLTTTARVAHRWNFVHDEVGYNYRLPNLNAALGCAQLEQLPERLAAKRILAGRYAQAFDQVDGIELVLEPAHARSNYWLNALLLSSERVDERDRLLEASNAAGIMTRPVWTLMHRLPMYRDCPRMPLPVAEDLERRLINIPSSPFLSDRHG